MAQNLTLNLGTIYNYGPVEQVDGSGNVLSPQNSDYGAPTAVATDPTVVAISGPIPGTTSTFQLQPLKVGTTTVTTQETSSTTGDVSPIQEVLNITVAGPQAEALHGTVAPAS